MNSLVDSQEMAGESRNRQLLRLIALAGLLPAVVAAANYFLMMQILRSNSSAVSITLQVAWYIAEVGFIGFLVGRGLRSSMVKWLVFGWVLLLINLLAMTLAMHETAALPQRLPPHVPSGALFAGQIGLCVVWACMGDTRWPVRLPAMILAIAALLMLWFNQWNTYDRRIWDELLVFNVATLAILCGLIRLSGFRLINIESARGTPGGTSLQSLQFGIKHVLIWTTVLAILLGIGRGMDLLRWEIAQQWLSQSKLWKFTMAAVSGIAIVVALWTALGRGHWVWRYSVGALLVLLLGAVVSAWSSYQYVAANALSNAGGWKQVDWELYRWHEVGWWWMAWMFLSGGLLAATLIILRVLGYRLVRVQRMSPRGDLR